MEGTESVEEIRITYGHSKDHRPDLKQFIMDVICTDDGDIPLFLRIADGNEADKAVFAKLMKQFREAWNLDSIYVADSALYSADNLQQLRQLRWITLAASKETDLSSRSIEAVKTTRFCLRCGCGNCCGQTEPKVAISYFRIPKN